MLKKNSVNGFTEQITGKARVSWEIQKRWIFHLIWHMKELRWPKEEPKNAFRHLDLDTSEPAVTWSSPEFNRPPAGVLGKHWSTPIQVMYRSEVTKLIHCEDSRSSRSWLLWDGVRHEPAGLPWGSSKTFFASHPRGSFNSALLAEHPDTCPPSSWNDDVRHELVGSLGRGRGRGVIVLLMWAVGCEEGLDLGIEPLGCRDLGHHLRSEMDFPAWQKQEHSCLLKVAFEVR